MSDLIQYALFRGIAAVLQLLPLTGVRVCARLLARFVFRFIPIRKQLTLAQLRRAFPDKDEEWIINTARGSYINLLTVIFELMWTPRLTAEMLPLLLRVHNPELIHDARKKGSGVVLMSGHFGNWEWLSIGVAAMLDLPFTVIVHPLHNPRVDALVEHWRTMRGNRVVPMGLAIRDIVRTLRERGIVALLADQSGPSGAIYVPFFGTPAATYEGPASFALKTGASIVMGFPERAADGAYDVYLTEIASRDLPDASEASIRTLTARHVKALEDAVRARPDHWLWLHKRWKHTPGPDARIAELPS